MSYDLEKAKEAAAAAVDLAPSGTQQMAPQMEECWLQTQTRMLGPSSQTARAKLRKGKGPTTEIDKVPSPRGCLLVSKGFLRSRSQGFV